MRKTTFIILCLEGAILSFNVSACSALIPSISRDFGITQFAAGRLIWLYMLPYGIAALFYGPLVRFFDAKKIELICFFLFSLSNLLAAFSNNLAVLFIARFLMGVFGASVIPLVLILISNQALPQERGKLIGIFFSATFIASLSGLFLSGIISWRLIFLIPAVLGFILWIHIYFYLPSFSRPTNKFKGGIPPEAGKEDTGNFKINYLAVFKDKTIIAVFIYIFFISLFYHGVQQWLAVYFSSRFYLSQFFVSMLITLTSLSGIFGEAIGGWMADEIGRIKTVDLGILCMAISLFFLVFKWPIAILALLMIIWGLGWTFNHAGLSTMLTDLPKEFLNEAASLNSSVRFIAGGMGAALGGVLMQRSFSMGFMTFCISLLLLFILSRAQARGASLRLY